MVVAKNNQVHYVTVATFTISRSCHTYTCHFKLLKVLLEAWLSRT